jgi:predicted RNA-binding protein YlxR (DUF448 family)
MGARPQRRRHVPHRTCVACHTTRPKQELVRVVRTPEGTVTLDETGKRSGRGAYLCRQRDCWHKALKQQQLERALKVKLTAESEAQLQDYAAGLPQSLTTETESEDDEETVRG